MRQWAAKRERPGERTREKGGGGKKEKGGRAASQVTEQLFMELLGGVFPLH